MTLHHPLFLRAFVLPILGPKVQAQATVLQVLKIAKITKNMMKILKLNVPRSIKKSTFYRHFIFVNVVEFAKKLKPIFLNNWAQSL